MNGVTIILITKLIIAVCCIPLVVFATQQPPIKLGMSAALSGPSAELGVQLKQGADAYFERVNANGGVNGRKIETSFSPYSIVQPISVLQPLIEP